MSKRSVLAGLLAALMLLSGCTLFGGKEEQSSQENHPLKRYAPSIISKTY